MMGDRQQMVEGHTRFSLRSNPAIEPGCGSSAGVASRRRSAPRLSMEIGALDPELGGRIEAVTVAYRTWGRLNAAATTRSSSSTR